MEFINCKINDINEKDFLNDRTEIKCVIKRLYSDFIVIEISSDGQVLQPNLIKKSTANLAKCSEKQELSKEKIMIPNEFANIANEIHKFKEVSDGLIEECIIDLKDFTKDVRKKLHKFIAECYSESLFTRCVNGQLQVKKSNGNSNNNRKRRYWPEEYGDFLHFTMAKENMDTHTAICAISRKLGLKPSSFSISGTKDRRAITVQRVTIYRVEQSRLENLHFPRIWLSDFNYSNKKLQLGDAHGNRFSIILREIQPPFDKNEFNKRVNLWEQYGFFNYFGSQRFGTCGVNTAEIGKLILAEKWKEAIHILLSPRNETNNFLRKSLECFIETGNAIEALKLLPLGDYSTHIERNLLSTLSKSPNAFKAAILALPRDVRTMYIHAYQSDVFNRIISMRKKVFGLKVLEGDLDKNGNTIIDMEKANIEQICLPLPSSEPNLPQNEVRSWYEEIAKMDQISGNSFQKLERQFAIGSIYRPFIVKPKNVAWEVLEYIDCNQILQNCEFVPKQQNWKSNKERERGKNAIVDQKPSMAIKIQFDLESGTYATIALQELMRTDFSKDSQRSLEKKLMTEKNDI